MMALFEPANSMLAPLAKATITVLFDPTMSSHLQAPVKVSVLLLPEMWAPPPAQFKVVDVRDRISASQSSVVHVLPPEGQSDGAR